MPEVMMGFELEFLSSSEHVQIANKLGKMGLELGKDRNGYKGWFLTFDGSLRGTKGKGNCGHELVSPVMALEDGLRKMKMLFDWMVENKHYTNTSCGFHVGLSVKDPDQMKKIDELKLMLLLDHATILRKFKRTNSNYCRNLKKQTLNAIKQNAVRWNENQGAWKGKSMDLEEKIRRCIPHEKFTSANLTKLNAANPYIEFRAMGSEDYHLRFDEVSKTIHHYAEVLKASVDDAEDAPMFERRKVVFFAEVDKTIDKERQKMKKEIEERQKAEEKRLKPLVEGDIKRRHMRYEFALKFVASKTEKKVA